MMYKDSLCTEDLSIVTRMPLRRASLLVPWIMAGARDTLCGKIRVSNEHAGHNVMATLGIATQQKQGISYPYD